MFKSLTLKSIFSTFKQLSFANPNILLVPKFIYFNKNKVSTFKSTMKLTINQIGFHPIFFFFVFCFLFVCFEFPLFGRWGFIWNWGQIRNNWIFRRRFQISFEIGNLIRGRLVTEHCAKVLWNEFENCFCYLDSFFFCLFVWFSCLSWRSARHFQNWSLPASVFCLKGFNGLKCCWKGPKPTGETSETLTGVMHRLSAGWFSGIGGLSGIELGLIVRRMRLSHDDEAQIVLFRQRMIDSLLDKKLIHDTWWVIPHSALRIPGARIKKNNFLKNPTFPMGKFQPEQNRGLKLPMLDRGMVVGAHPHSGIATRSVSDWAQWHWNLHWNGICSIERKWMKGWFNE